MLTPNLDRLAREGAVFTSAYTPNPVCVPARHNLITGLPASYHGYFTNSGAPMPRDIPVLPGILMDEGYDTRAVGKMHYRPARRHNGFAKMELMAEIPRFREDDEYAMYLKAVGLGGIHNIHGVRNLLYMVPQRSLIPEEHHGSTWVGDRSVDYILKAAGRRPFFLFSGWIAPHPPFDVPEPFCDMYAGRDLPEPYVSETPVSGPAGRSRWNADGPGGSGEPLVRRVRELYCGAISLIDKSVGRILDALEDTGELDNTLVIFTSDHGEMLGDHGAYQKMLPYDSCSRIPFIARYPERIEGGTVRDDFVDLNDVLPTVLDVTGVEYPGGISLPGGSIFRDDKDRSHQYMEYGKGATRWVSLRNARFKYNYYYGGGYEELLDLVEDPRETVNLLYSRSDEPEVREARDRLRAALVGCEETWGPEHYVAGGDFIELKAPEYRPSRNSQFQTFPLNLSEEERAQMGDPWEEAIRATRDEESVNLHELDLEAWERNGAPREVVERIRREGL